MKTQRSRIHIITLLLLCTFFLTVLICARHIGLVSVVLPDNGEEGNPPAPEESLNQSENIPDGETGMPDSPAEDETLFDTTGL